MNAGQGISDVGRLTVGRVLARIRAELGPAWDEAGGDGLQVGAPESTVTGIAVAWTPSVEVLRRAREAGANVIVTRERPFWSREETVAGYSGAGTTATRAQMSDDATFRYKQTLIAQYQLAICRLGRSWDATHEGASVRRLVTSLGWQSRPSVEPGLVTLPSTTVRGLAEYIRGRLGVRAMRILGDPGAIVAGVAVTQGFLLVPQVQRLVSRAGIDVIVAGEPVEWEAYPYVADLVTAGRMKGMILLGHLVSAEPGSIDVAEWLRGLVPDVPVHVLHASEPFWTAGSPRTKG